ncbi:hypothetical protein EHS25_008411 [Saitozyma podzolica]|uniref:DUF1772 domain-containing protein n=1 Tax=Saitozyma podzolica TaxID=1890683 RepID=A0A427YPE2_9TREE|nr:hypothetical protein EHS25_008411 [Saitozyma podzolica]
MGIIPLLNQRLGPFDVSAKQRAKAFAVHLKKAGFWTISSSAVSAILGFTVAYLHPDPLTRRLLLISGIASLGIFPITAASQILKINSELCKYNREDSLSDVAKGSAQYKRVEELVKKWEGKHKLRFASYFTAWALSLSAVVLNLKP